MKVGKKYHLPKNTLKIPQFSGFSPNFQGLSQIFRGASGSHRGFLFPPLKGTLPRAASLAFTKASITGISSSGPSKVATAWLELVPKMAVPQNGGFCGRFPMGKHAGKMMKKCRHSWENIEKCEFSMAKNVGNSMGTKDVGNSMEKMMKRVERCGGSIAMGISQNVWFLSGNIPMKNG